MQKQRLLIKRNLVTIWLSKIQKQEKLANNQKRKKKMDLNSLNLNIMHFTWRWNIAME